MNEFMQRPSRPTAEPAAPTSATQPTPANNKKTSKLSLGHGLNIGVGVLLFSGAIIAFALIALLITNNSNASSVSRENDRVIDGAHQAVFLDDNNGQVYFGDLEVLDEDTYMLTGIYYVQVQTAIQPDTGEEQTTGISLAKLGNELHGPLDQMFINKDRVLFWENLKSNGQVSCAIAQYRIDEGEEDVTRDPKCDENQQQAQTQENTGEQAPAQPQTTNQTQTTQPAGTPQSDDTPQNQPDPNFAQ